MYLWAWRDSNSQNTCTSSMPVYLNCDTNPYCCAEGGIRTHTLSLLRRSRLPVATLQHLENRWDSNPRELIRLDPNLCTSNILFSLYRQVDSNHRPRGYESLATTTVLRRYVSIRWESNPQDSVSKTNMSSCCITNRSFAVIEGIEPSPHDRQSRILTIGPYHQMYLLCFQTDSNRHFSH